MLTVAVLLAGSLLLDAAVRPRPASAGGIPLRCLPGLVLQSLMALALFGLFLALCGNAAVSVAMALAIVALLAVASNAKNAMLGEPLLFSDLALIGAIFRHPQFYLSAVSLWQRVLASLGGMVLLAVLALLFVPDPWIHLSGLGIALGSLAALALFLRIKTPCALTPHPDAHLDVQRFGLLPALLLYWLRWRESSDPLPHPHPHGDAPGAALRKPHEAEVAVIVQCESFADPAELFGDPELALPALDAARAIAWQSGRLHVSGFGAYTMRTEYGVLFGRDEADLGFRRYDPFLTALGEHSYALPNRLKTAGWQSLFLHPHDMRFYGRDRIMPAGGFSELVGQDRFAPPRAHEGRYVTDAAMADVIADLARDLAAPTLLYAVTIENHGPWAPEQATGPDALTESYLRLVRNSDAMLQRLLHDLAVLGRPATLVFFGDHRPSIPGVTAPGSARHTPYVIVRMDAQGQLLRGAAEPVDLTPAELHHTVLAALTAPAIVQEA
ncbi:LTA synthase family protein [Novosphingobium sp. PY1]|uniref:Capsular polysaccharide biosynthesis protein n=1 Tax=Ochrobactrum sp. PW1 TaxID=1882222 RepID=A0A292GT71_9HYPH|nr:LTA synthase family protein [Novosphingobium sp. PY1]BBA74322.1 capsular polysaccharide biosynthesis protein [Ochrobactrum sp. PW1]GFM29171.1 capsular polysaccharide biosynthesis protein [Novosphingobium sp. PY1]